MSSPTEQPKPSVVNDEENEALQEQSALDPEFSSLRVDVSRDEPIEPSLTPSSRSINNSPNIFVAGIPFNWDEATMREVFAPYGSITSVRVVPNRHYGFVMFNTAVQAQAAIKALHNHKPSPSSVTLLHVSPAMHDEGADAPPGDRIFIRGLPPWMSRDELKNIFSTIGPLVQCSILYSSGGQCKGCAFVQYSTVEEATQAIEELGGKKLENWGFPLEIKFSEPMDHRTARQQRNRERIAQAFSPRTTPAGTPYAGGRPFANVNLPAQIPLPSPKNEAGPFGVLLPPVPFPFPVPFPPLLSPPAHTATPLLIPQSYSLAIPSIPPAAPPLSAVPAVSGLPLPPAPLAPFPTMGDLFCCGVPLSVDTVRQLFARFGAITHLRRVSGGYVVRLVDPRFHISAAHNLSGTLFSSGHVWQVAVIAQQPPGP